MGSEPVLSGRLALVHACLCCDCSAGPYGLCDQPACDGMAAQLCLCQANLYSCRGAVSTWAGWSASWPASPAKLASQLHGL